MSDTPGRLLALLSLLQTPREWPGSELARRLDVSPRTVRRDVDRLRDLGYPVEATLGAAGGYRLVAGSALPPLLLDDEEAVAIAVGLRAAAGTAVAGVEEASVRALGKLEQVLPSRLRHRVRTLGAATLPVGADGPVVDPEVLTALAGAAATRERVRFRYTAGDARESSRLVEPLALVPSGRRWYLVAWDVDRSAGHAPPAGLRDLGRSTGHVPSTGHVLSTGPGDGSRSVSRVPSAGVDDVRRATSDTPPGWEGSPTLRAGTDNHGRRDGPGDRDDHGDRDGHGGCDQGGDSDGGRERDGDRDRHGGSDGGSGDRDGWRTFRVDRIARVQPTGVRVREQRTLPADDAAAYVAGRRTDWGTPELRVVVTFEAPAHAVAGRLGDAPGQVVAVDGGRCRLDAHRDDSMDWLASRLVLLGCPFTVEAPDELRAAVRTLAERAASAVTARPGS